MFVVVHSCSQCSQPALNKNTAEIYGSSSLQVSFQVALQSCLVYPRTLVPKDFGWINEVCEPKIVHQGWSNTKAWGCQRKQVFEERIQVT